MKKIIIATFLMFQLNSLAQVGINTTTPTRTLDVNGNLRIKTLVDKSETSSYSNVLIVDSNGNIDHLLRSDLLPKPDEFTSNKVVVNNLYTNIENKAIVGKVITCGDFRFRFIQDPAGRPAIQLAPKVAPANDVNVYISMEQNWDGTNGFQFYQGTSESNTSPFTFVKGSTDFIYFAQPNLADFEQNVLHFQYPGQKAFYRLTAYKVPYTVTNAQDTTTNLYDFTAICEKF